MPDLKLFMVEASISKIPMLINTLLAKQLNIQSQA